MWLLKRLTRSFMIVAIQQLDSEVSMQKDWSWPGQYKPFKYPPDYELAKIHQNTTIPGYPDLFKPHCTCCNMPGKKPYSSWFNRSIERDFHHYGGGVVTHFWLVRLFLVTVVLALLVFGAYVQYLSWYYCTEDDASLRTDACRSLFRIWIISNEDLYEMMIKEKDWNAVFRFSILRSILFVILITANTGALYLVGSYKSLYPDTPSEANFSLLFKNTPESIDQLLTTLRAEFGNFSVHQAFIIRQAEPFYTQYKQKLEIYFECKLEHDPSRVANLLKKLRTLKQECQQSELQFGVNSRRAIIVFNDYSVRQRILQKYKMGWFLEFCSMLCLSWSGSANFICEQCPRVRQLIWHNIGVQESKVARGKLLSIFLFVVLLVLAVAILYVISFLVYLRDDEMYWNVVIQNIVLFTVSMVILYFRELMYVLAEYRFPYTYSSRAMFVIITSTLLHFIFYVWLPSIYVRLFMDIRGQTLRLMSNQAISGILMQILFISVDLKHFIWSIKLPNVQSEQNPMGCQKMIHQHIQYPRYPLQQRSITLFKFWSLITFFAFHVPFVLVILLIGLLFFYFKDKFNIYRHYRMQMIGNNVKFYYLRIYTNIFTLTIFASFVYTQREMVQKITSATITIIALFLQIFYFRKMVKTNLQNDEQGGQILLNTTIGSDIHTFYQKAHDSFFKETKNEELDNKINQFLSHVSLSLKDN